MSSRRSPLFSVLILLLWLAGCTSAPDFAPEDLYQAPARGASTAQIKGTSLSEGGLFGSEHRGFVFMVDLKSIRDARGNWDQPVFLTPGDHNIGVEYQYSNFTARAYLSLFAKAGGTYQLMIKQGRDKPEGPPYNDFWIVDQATGNTVTHVLRRQLMGGKKGTVFYMNK